MGTMLSISVTGFVGGDVDLREVGEQRVASFSVAVNRKTSNGEQKTVWVRVNCWNKLADVATQYVHKGSLILAMAEWMRPSAWVDQNGNPQASVDITANRLVLLDRVNGDNPNSEIPEDEIPF